MVLTVVTAVAVLTEVIVVTVVTKKVQYNNWCDKKNYKIFCGPKTAMWQINLVWHNKTFVAKQKTLTKKCGEICCDKKMYDTKNCKKKIC